MQKDILFDNIYIGHSEADAAKLKAQTFDVKKPIEAQEAEASKPKVEDTPEAIKSPMDLVFMDDPVHYVREKVELFTTLAKRNPIDAIKFVPEVAAAIGLILVALLTLLFGGLGAAATSPQVQKTVQKTKEAAVDAKDKAAEAISTGADRTQVEVNKRTTRSTVVAEL